VSSVSEGADPFTVSRRRFRPRPTSGRPDPSEPAAAAPPPLIPPPPSFSVCSQRAVSSLWAATDQSPRSWSAGWWCSSSSAVYRRKLNLKATFQSGSSGFSVKRFVPDAFNAGFIWLTYTALPRGDAGGRGGRRCPPRRTPRGEAGARCQGLTLVNFSAQHKRFLTQNTP